MVMMITNDTNDHEQKEFLVKDEIEIVFEYSDIKKQNLGYLIGNMAEGIYGYKIDIVPKFGKELLGLKEYLDSILRSCTWLIGRFSYSLIRIRRIEKETDEEKNYKLLV
jgi:hypothetical protein